MCHRAKGVEPFFPPFFPIPHHETTLQRQSYTAISDFVPFSGDPRECKGYVAIVGPQEGRGYGATYEFIPFVGDPRERKGFVATFEFVHFVADP